MFNENELLNLDDERLLELLEQGKITEDDIQFVHDYRLDAEWEAEQEMKEEIEAWL